MSMLRPSRLLLCASVLWLLFAPLPAAGAAEVHAPQQQPDTTEPQDQDGTRKTYVPLVASAAAGDVSVAAIEVTQAVQTATMTVPLVAGRPAVARVYVAAVGRSYTNLTVTLAATRNGSPLAGSPLRRTGVTARTSYSRLRRSDSVNFLLPAAWLSGNVTLTATVAFASGQDARPGDNTRRLAVAFRTVAPLAVTIVPIRYVHAPSGTSYAPPTTFPFLAHVQAMFPVPSIQLKVRSPVMFRGDVTFDSGVARIEPWQDLLNLILALKRSDGAPQSTMYVGVLPGSVINTHKVYLAGIGSSARAVVGFDVGLILAHEMGHGLGRRHAPCGNPSGVDPAYPYPGALIGAIGYDTAHSTVFDPATTTDLMSYCEEWVSDYTYAGMLADQVASAGDGSNAAHAAAAQPALLVRATIDEQGAAALAPLYAFDAPTSELPDASRYQVAYAATDGSVVASYPVAVAEAEEHGLTARVLNAVLPRPQTPIAEVRLVADGVVLARRTVAAAGPSAPDVQVGEDAVVIAANAPTLVRRVTAGTTETLAVDLEGVLEFAPNSLAGGAGWLEVVPADVIPEAGVASLFAPLDLPDATPALHIGAPAPAPLGTGYVIGGYAYDPEDGTIEVEWMVDGAVVARGPLLQIESLTGALGVEARARDSSGRQVSVNLLIAPAEPSTSPPE